MTTRTITIEEYYFVYVKSLINYPHIARFGKHRVTAVVFDLDARYKLTLSDKTEHIVEDMETVVIEEQ